MNVTEHDSTTGGSFRGTRRSSAGAGKVTVEGLDDRECQLLKASARPVHFTDGQLLFREGEESHSIYFIRQGKVEVGHSHSEVALMDMGPYGFVDVSECEECWIPKQVMGRGECVGESATLEGQPHYLAAKGVGEVDLLELDTQEVKAVLAQNPHIRSCLRHVLLEK